MRKLKLYLETSAWNFYYAEDAPEKQAITRQFFARLPNYEIFISELVHKEIARAKPERKRILSNLIEQHHPADLIINEAVLTLAASYRNKGVLPVKAVNDSIHAAIATVYEMDALISWNLRHLANLNRMQKINEVNLIQGYSRNLELITPVEVADAI
ncbi:MAG: hypothetical protein BWK78_06450 [Thiotrichaceae bacterium IS1]|nr:MAG: hypothetical protein BWK78_06450 [Thiotrichaceae bacterium IS1]